jgi:hypothetical protein
MATSSRKNRSLNMSYIRHHDANEKYIINQGSRCIIQAVYDSRLSAQTPTFTLHSAALKKMSRGQKQQTNQ